MVIRGDAAHLPLPDASTLAYLAGVMDSDGYIGVHRNTYSMRVRGDAKQPVYQARAQVPDGQEPLFELYP